MSIRLLAERVGRYEKLVELYEREVQQLLNMEKAIKTTCEKCGNEIITIDEGESTDKSCWKCTIRANEVA